MEQKKCFYNLSLEIKESRVILASLFLQGQWVGGKRYETGQTKPELMTSP